MGKRLEERRRFNRERRRRQRANAKARAKVAAEKARLHAEREEELRAASLVPMYLLEDLCLADHSHLRGETIWVVPGLVWQWGKRQLAVEIQRPASYGVRVITGLSPDRFVTEPQEPPKERTAAGY